MIKISINAAYASICLGLTSRCSRLCKLSKGQRLELHVRDFELSLADTTSKGGVWGSLVPSPLHARARAAYTAGKGRHVVKRARVVWVQPGTQTTFGKCPQCCLAIFHYYVFIPIDQLAG